MAALAGIAGWWVAEALCIYLVDDVGLRYGDFRDSPVVHCGGRSTDFPALVPNAAAICPVAALTALVIPELLMPQGALWLSLNNARLVAGLVAIAIAVQTRSVLWTLVGLYDAGATEWGCSAIDHS